MVISNYPYIIFIRLFALVFLLSNLQFVDAQVYQHRVQAQRQILTRPISDTPKRKVSVHDRIGLDSRAVNVFGYGTTDTVWDLKPYLQSKAGCEFTQTLDLDGCVLVTYADGFIKKVCDGDVIEVTLPSGKKYRRKMGQSFRNLVIPIPPPPNPSGQENSYKWLASYNDALLDEIKDLLKNDRQSVNVYMKNESAVCKAQFYKQIEYRTFFIEELLKAK